MDENMLIRDIIPSRKRVRKRNFPKIILSFFVIYIIVSILNLSLSVKNSYATTQIRAVDLLGQLDENFQPVFTGLMPATGKIGFLWPTDVALDTINHRLFVADGQNNRILIFNLDSNNQLIDRVADNVLGQPDFTTGSAGLSQSTFTFPGGLDYDSVNQRLFVADEYNRRILVFDVSTITNGENAVNVLGQPDFNTDTPACSQNKTNYTADVAYDAENNRLFVSDSWNYRILVFDVAAITDGEPAINVLGSTTFTLCGQALDQSHFTYPKGLTYDSINQRLFVADSYESRVMVFDVAAITNGEPAINVLGQLNFTSGNPATTQSGLRWATGLTYDSANQRLFVADSGMQSDLSNHRVMVFDVATITNGEPAINVLGQSNFISGTSATAQNRLNLPNDLAYDSTNQRLFVADMDNNRVMVFDVATIINGENAVDLLGHVDASGQIVSYTAAGQDNTPNDYMMYPGGSVIDSVNHRLFQMDFGGQRILVFNLDSNNQLNDRIADNVLGQPDFFSNASATTQNGLRICNPTTLAYDSQNQRLFVAEDCNNRVTVFDVSTITNGENAINVLGQPDFISNAPATTQNGMNYPSGLAYDSQNQRLFVAEWTNNRITVFDVATITNGDPAINVLGQLNFTSNASATTQNGLNGPSGLAYDSSNQRLFVTDMNNNRIMVFDVTTVANGDPAINVLGQLDFLSNAPATTQDGLNFPYGLAYDSPNQRLFAADSNNNRATVFDVSIITNGEPAINVLGQVDFTSSVAVTTQDGLNYPLLILYDSSSQKIFIADFNNARVLIFQMPKITDEYLTTAVIDKNYSDSISIIGGEPPYTCELFSGSLPLGLTLNSNCTISGFTTGGSDSTITVKVTDDSAPVDYGFWDFNDLTVAVTIAIQRAPPEAPPPTPTPPPPTPETPQDQEIESLKSQILSLHQQILLVIKQIIELLSQKVSVLQSK